MNIVEFNFNIGDIVTIRELGIKARIQSLQFDGMDKFCQIVYWKEDEDGKARIIEWMEEYELE